METHRLVGAGHVLLFRLLSHRCIDERGLLRVKHRFILCSGALGSAPFVLNESKLNNLLPIHLSGI